MKKALIWILAIVITLAAAYYQRKTGPTYPKKVSWSLNDQEYNSELIRSSKTGEDCPIVIPADENTNGIIIYRRYPFDNKWDTISMVTGTEGLSAALPSQPPAGKLAYQIILSRDNEEVVLPEEEPVIIRFKGGVPAGIMVPHIIIMFFAMLLSNAAGLMALWKLPRFKLYATLTLIFLFIGGGILGPLVQKYAFGDLWTGIPFGWDLTDNKTLIALVMWLVAVLFNRKKERYGWVVAAAVVLLLVYSIPHSMFGSEFNYETGEVIQGMILPWMI